MLPNASSTCHPHTQQSMRHHSAVYYLAKHHFDLVILLQFFLCQLPLAGPVEAVTRCTYQIAARIFAQSCFVWCYPCPFNLTIIQSEEESCTVRGSVLVLHLVHQREVKYNQILPYTSLASARTVPCCTWLRAALNPVEPSSKTPTGDTICVWLSKSMTNTGFAPGLRTIEHSQKAAVNATHRFFGLKVMRLRSVWFSVGPDSRKTVRYLQPPV